MALADMAGQQRNAEGALQAICLADIAERQGITVAYLEQIFSKLRVAGIVKSQRGPGGGYMLARDVSEIKISEVIKAAEEKIKMTRCSDSAQPCMGGSKCLTHDLWNGLGKTIENYFNAITLADVVNKKVNRAESYDFINGQNELSQQQAN